MRNKKPKEEPVISSGIDFVKSIWDDIDDIMLLKDALEKQSNYRVYSTGFLMLDCAIGERDPLTGKMGVPERTIIEDFGRNSSLKCFGINTPILMYDGTIKLVQDIEVGDQLMGPDSSPRTVTELHRGKDDLYRVSPSSSGWNDWICNANHILSLKTSGLELSSSRKRIEISPGIWRGSEKRIYKTSTGEVVNISVKDFLKLSKRKQSYYRLYKSNALTFKSNKKLLIDPYYLGIWLGDGHSDGTSVTTADKEVVDYLKEYSLSIGSNLTKSKQEGLASEYSIVGTVLCKEKIGSTHGRSANLPKHVNPLRQSLRDYSLINNKHIPFDYKTASIEERLQLLAGILDSDGTYNRGKNTFVIVQKSNQLANDIVFIARSLGLKAFISPVTNWCMYKGEKKEAVYNSIHISGNISSIPTKIERKKASIKEKIKNINPLVSRFTLENLGSGDFYGFSVDGPDQLFLLADFTVVHNSAKYEQLTKNILADDPSNIVIVLYTEESDLDRWTSIGIPKNHQDRIIALGCNEGEDVLLHLAEKNLDRIKLAVQDPRVKLVVIDSIKGLCLAKQLYTKKGEITSLEDSEQLALRAKLIGEFIRDFKQLNKKSILYMTNQVSDKLQLSPGDLIVNPQFTVQTPGGRAKEFECHLRLQSETRPVYSLVEHELTGKKVLRGWELSCRLVKNKFCRTSGNRVAVGNFYFDPPGFNRLEEVLNLNRYLTSIGRSSPELTVSKTNNGRWTVPGSETTVLTKELKEYFANNPEAFSKLETNVLDNAEFLFKPVKEEEMLV